jgi:hypothetical protein
MGVMDATVRRTEYRSVVRPEVKINGIRIYPPFK